MPLLWCGLAGGDVMKLLPGVYCFVAVRMGGQLGGQLGGCIEILHVTIDTRGSRQWIEGLIGDGRSVGWFLSLSQV